MKSKYKYDFSKIHDLKKFLEDYSDLSENINGREEWVVELKDLVQSIFTAHQKLNNLRSHQYPDDKGKLGTWTSGKLI